MPAILSAARKHTEVLDLIMATMYVVLTAYLFASNAPPRIAFALREVATPFQIKVRARNTGAERSLAAWQSAQFEARTGILSR